MKTVTWPPNTAPRETPAQIMQYEKVELLVLQLRQDQQIALIDAMTKNFDAETCHRVGNATCQRGDRLERQNLPNSFLEQEGKDDA